MNVEDAKTKWCPFVTVTYINQRPVTNRKMSENADQHNCIADDCMVWVEKPGQPGEGDCGRKNK